LAPLKGGGGKARIEGKGEKQKKERKKLVGDADEGNSRLEKKKGRYRKGARLTEGYSRVKGI